MRLVFSVAINVDDILLIDEILSVGDQNFQRKASANCRKSASQVRS